MFKTIRNDIGKKIMNVIQNFNNYKERLRAIICF